jgi:hypothetical protein
VLVPASVGDAENRSRLPSNDGGILLEHCALVDDERACALEYNVVRWGRRSYRRRRELPSTFG